nr:COX assembly mitochondrial protein 2 homolog isoform X2 [Oryctolagus cuniculus]XP_017197871.1 COX assembly mitochondrial protein 2 homolog isoform X2 [Oryctolagus cuniculus]XP_051702992.1 COX assembly mitochondrial protein 2 homolog isoform X2 [Oryctolagus cuniculus]
MDETWGVREEPKTTSRFSGCACQPRWESQKKPRKPRIPLWIGKPQVHTLNTRRDPRVLRQSRRSRQVLLNELTTKKKKKTVSSNVPADAAEEAARTPLLSALKTQPSRDRAAPLPRRRVPDVRPRPRPAEMTSRPGGVPGPSPSASVPLPRAGNRAPILRLETRGSRETVALQASSGLSPPSGPRSLAARGSLTGPHLQPSLSAAGVPARGAFKASNCSARRFQAPPPERALCIVFRVRGSACDGETPSPSANRFHTGDRLSKRVLGWSPRLLCWFILLLRRCMSHWLRSLSPPALESGLVWAGRRMRPRSGGRGGVRAVG